jgi:hypothetical protein
MAGGSRGRSGAVLAAMLSIVIVLGAGEALIRFFLFHSSSPLATMTVMNYVINFCGDDTYYRLGLQFQARALGARGHEENFVPPTFDPMLGWTAKPRTSDNPLGLVHSPPYRLDDLKRKPSLLFLGDSFVAGTTRLEQTLPYQLGTMLPGLSVINAGVPGYGLDQTYLHLRTLVGYFDHPHVLVGILFNDIDRVAYAVHASVKPYFELDGDRLVERNVPIPPSPRTWPEMYPPPPRLYVLGALVGLVHRAVSTRWGVEHLYFLHPCESHVQRGRKMAVSEAILRAVRDECAQRDVPVAVVLFPHVEHAAGNGWYAPWLHRTLDQLGIPYLDLTDVLRRHVRERNLDWSRDVYRPYGHPNPEENALFARHIAAFLRAKYGPRFGSADSGH